MLVSCCLKLRKVWRYVIIYTRSIIDLQIRFGWWNWWGILVEVHGWDKKLMSWHIHEVYSWWCWYIFMSHSWWAVDTWLVHTWNMVSCTCLWYKFIIDFLVQIGAWLMHLFMVQVGAWLMHLFMVQVDYSLRYRLMHGSTYWYSFTVVYITVIVWHWVYHSTSTSWRLDEARKSGCSRRT